MDLVLSPAEAAFRDELRSWLDGNLPAGWGTPSFRLPKDTAERVRFFRDWQATMDAAGWVAINWPRANGGRDATLVEQIVYHQELAARKAPPLIGHNGLSICGPTLIVHGTDEQRARFLGPMRSGAEIWCQGFSEPDAGSDLASLRTKGSVDGDELVIDGHKIWTSGAHLSDWMFALVRTDPAAPKRHGISFVLIPMDAAGITVRPIKQISGESEFSEVFFDGVRVPVANVVGGLNEGWSVARTTLSHERATLFMASQIRFSRVLEEVVELAKTTAVNGGSRADDPALRQRLARAWVDAQLISINGMRNVARVIETGEPGPEGSMMKLFGQEAEKSLHELAVDVAGAGGVLDRGADGAPGGGKWLLGYLRSRASTIGGGTSEIQRNIIAERVLGMPRDPWADDD